MCVCADALVGCIQVGSVPGHGRGVGRRGRGAGGWGAGREAAATPGAETR